MRMFPLNQSTFNVLERSLDATSLRQSVIANNIANVDTPYFKKSEVRFEELLQKELQASSSTFAGYRTNPRHFPIGQNTLSSQPVIQVDEHSKMNNNMNNVDIDYEMTLMAKNQLKYNTLVQQINQEFRLMRTAIDGRR